MQDYRRPADPPPGPAWQSALGVRPLRVALVSLYVIENSGMRLLASLLRGEGVEVHEYYFKDWLANRVVEPRPEELACLVEEVGRFGPHLVGLSVRASAFHRIARTVTEALRRALRVPVLWGGMHATSCPDDALRVADMVAVGEAELTVVELARRLSAGESPEGLEGLWLHGCNGIVRGGQRPLVQNLDSLPFADFHSPAKSYIDGRRVVPGDPYVREPVYLLMASRGCPFPSCTFCSNSVMDRVYDGQRYFRVRSVDSVLAEVAYARRHFRHLRTVRFDDEEFPVQPAWFDEFCRRWPAEAGVPFEIHMDPRVVTEERLHRLRDAGLTSVFMGIQSSAEINRKLYGRNIADEGVLAAAEAVHASGARAGYQVILDDPVSTSEDKRRCFDLLLRLPRPYELILFSLTVYPMSALAQRLLADGVIDESEVEGPATKVFRQFRVSLDFDRSQEDRFWTALAVMVSKDFVPRRLLAALSRSGWLERHPGGLEAAAFVANSVKLAGMGLGLLWRGEMSMAILRRWLTFRRSVTF